ncbi:MAG TPA: glycoside hydrolase family 43 protein [Acidimicrobiales bacterium]|nr:glycoside hydrolase family 43 protein [Acidimicrobiales bacterium]
MAPGDAAGLLTLERDPAEPAPAGPRPTPSDVTPLGGALAAVVLGMVAAAVYRQGGFYPPDAFGLAVVSAGLVFAVLRRFRDRASVQVTVAVGALALWWLVRSIAAHRIVAFFPLGAALLGFLAAFLVIRCLGVRDRTRVAYALIAIATVAALLGLAGVLWHLTSWAQHTGGYWQLTTPLTQPASAAALLAMTLLVALALSLEHPLVRVALCLLLAAFIATQSHWSLLAFAVGALLIPRRCWLVAWLPLAAGLVAGAAVVASASGHLSPWLAAALVLAGAVASWRGEAWQGARMGASTARAVAVVVLLVVAAGTTLLVLRPPGVAGPSEPANQSQSVAWSGAAQAWRSSILTGVAPPTIYSSDQAVDTYPGLTPDADVTVAADGGLIGAALLVGVIAAVAGVRRRRTALAACALGATATFAVAGAVDVAWQLPALAIAGGCVVGLWARGPAETETETGTGTETVPRAEQGPAGPAGPAAVTSPAQPGRRGTAVPAFWAVALVVLLVLQLTVGLDRGSAGGLAHVQSAAPARSATPLAPARTILRGPDVTDPYMVQWQGHDLIYASQGTSFLNVPVRAGTPGHFGPPTDALPHLPSWATGGATWAPDVHQVAGGWALYFTSLLRGAAVPTHCIGAAFGSSPTGPFVATDRPFICQLDHRGSIDARVFVDAGKLIMLWKSEDNANPHVPGPDQGGPTGIYAQDLSGDGRTLVGQPVKILGPSQPWEGTIVEAPDMIEAWGTYWLFFSGNWYYSSSYGIGVAACQSPLGPCADVNPAPLLTTNLQGSGPGEESLFVDGADVWLLYNPFKSNDPGPVIPRPAVMTRLGFTPQGPYLAAP